MNVGDKVTITFTIQGDWVVGVSVGTIITISGSSITINIGTANAWKLKQNALSSDGPGAWKMTAQVKL
ncbi:MAG: hypothetical protein IH993_08055 [Proteobacteria bacterium]|nr:hypothetical protein [Pseudomonadota bacterium]